MKTTPLRGMLAPHHRPRGRTCSHSQCTFQRQRVSAVGCTRNGAAALPTSGRIKGHTQVFPTPKGGPSTFFRPSRPSGSLYRLPACVCALDPCTGTLQIREVGYSIHLNVSPLVGMIRFPKNMVVAKWHVPKRKRGHRGLARVGYLPTGQRV